MLFLVRTRLFVRELGKIHYVAELINICNFCSNLVNSASDNRPFINGNTSSFLTDKSLHFPSCHYNINSEHYVLNIHIYVSCSLFNIRIDIYMHNNNT